MTSETTRDSTALWLYGRVGLVCLLALLSAFFSKLSLPAALLSLLVFLSLPNDAARALRIALALAGLIAVVSLVRFVVTEAMPGMVQGGRAAAAQSAISRLREIVFAEDTLRKHAYIDADRDGVGSAALLGELSGMDDVRGLGKKFDPPILGDQLRPVVATKLGPAAASAGYLVIVCLPTRSGGWTARAGEPIDEERAERHYFGYAWPDAAAYGMRSAYAVDQDERILVSSNIEHDQTRWAGPNFPPPCDAALDSASGFRPWRDKKPRSTLPGDR